MFVSASWSDVLICDLLEGFTLVGGIRKCDAPFKNLSKKFRHGFRTEPKVATYEKLRCVLNSSMIHFAMAEFFLTIQHRSSSSVLFTHVFIMNDMFEYSPL